MWSAMPNSRILKCFWGVVLGIFVLVPISSASASDLGCTVTNVVVAPGVNRCSPTGTEWCITTSAANTSVTITSTNPGIGDCWTGTTNASGVAYVCSSATLIVSELTCSESSQLGPGQCFFFLTSIPTVSEWGLVIMTLLCMTAGTIFLVRYRAASPANNV